MQYTCLITIDDPGMRSGPGSNWGPFGLEDECSTTKLTGILLVVSILWNFISMQ